MLLVFTRLHFPTYLCFLCLETFHAPRILLTFLCASILTFLSKCLQSIGQSVFNKEFLSFLFLSPETHPGDVPWDQHWLSQSYYSFMSRIVICGQQGIIFSAFWFPGTAVICCHRSGICVTSKLKWLRIRPPLSFHSAAEGRGLQGYKRKWSPEGWDLRL